MTHFLSVAIMEATLVVLLLDASMTRKSLVGLFLAVWELAAGAALLSGKSMESE
jgi:hypothetical protein